MPEYNVAEAKKEYAKQPYRGLWSWARIAEVRMGVDAPFLKRVVMERENPMLAGYWPIVRDMFRRSRKQIYCFRGGHLKALTTKIKMQKLDKDRIRLYLMGGGFVATVIGFLYGVYYLQD